MSASLAYLWTTFPDVGGDGRTPRDQLSSSLSSTGDQSTDPCLTEPMEAMAEEVSQAMSQDDTRFAWTPGPLDDDQSPWWSVPFEEDETILEATGPADRDGCTDAHASACIPRADSMCVRAPAALRSSLTSGVAAELDVVPANERMCDLRRMPPCVEAATDRKCDPRGIVESSMTAKKQSSKYYDTSPHNFVSDVTKRADYITDALAVELSTRFTSIKLEATTKDKPTAHVVKAASRTIEHPARRSSTKSEDTEDKLTVRVAPSTTREVELRTAPFNLRSEDAIGNTLTARVAQPVPRGTELSTGSTSIMSKDVVKKEVADVQIPAKRVELPPCPTPIKSEDTIMGEPLTLAPEAQDAPHIAACPTGRHIVEPGDAIMKNPTASEGPQVPKPAVKTPTGMMVIKSMNLVIDRSTAHMCFRCGFYTKDQTTSPHKCPPKKVHTTKPKKPKSVQPIRPKSADVTQADDRSVHILCRKNMTLTWMPVRFMSYSSLPPSTVHPISLRRSAPSSSCTVSERRTNPYPAGLSSQARRAKPPEQFIHL
jgi:hypothetical protein